MRFIAPYSLIVGGSIPLHLHGDHLADLRGSGLTDGTIAAAGVYSLRPCDLKLFFSWRRGVPAEVETALVFPYQGGEFARIKLFPALDKMKYAQPPRTSARLYIPVPLTAGPSYVCEGEKKTLAALQNGLNAIGVGGVWNWISKSEPIDDLKLIEWDGRDVVIIPDSDVFNRRDLLNAIYALGRELRSTGAAVFVAQIPQADAKKVGLDDFLVSGREVRELQKVMLGDKVFRAAQFWYGRWKMKTVALAA
jgi:hypothetical protein